MRPLPISIIIPVRDERENLDPLWRELRGALEGIGEDCEVLFVDDGSRDGSGEFLEELAASDSRIRVLHLREASGQSAALDAGTRASRGAILVTLDADLQNDPADIPRLLGELPSRGAAVGVRVGRRDSWIRRVESRIANAVRNAATGDSIRDTGCSLKAFRREALEAIRLYDGMHRFLPTLLRMEGFEVREVPVGHRPRRAGRSKYTLLGRLSRGVFDLLAVRWMIRRRLRYRLIGKVEPFSGKGRNSRAG